jgi:hypothetical protein
MGLIDRQSLIREMSHTVDCLLVTQLVDEFISAEKRYVLRDWEPLELDGGQFSEVAARILYTVDTGNVNRSKDLDECLKRIENDALPHSFPVRRDALHISRVLRTIYKFRSQRGAVHISPTYSPNQLDARFVLEAVKWVFAEFVRIFWNGDREEAAKAVREIVSYEVPAVKAYDGRLFVQRTDLTAEEEILIILFQCGDDGASRADIGRWAMCSAPSVTRSLQKLVASNSRQVILLGSGNYQLTDLGIRRVKTKMADKLLIRD